MALRNAGAYFDAAREQEHHLRHTLPALTQLDLSRMPHTVQQLAKIIGLPATMILVEYFGGVTLRIPHGATNAGREMLAMLADKIGHSNAKLIAQHIPLLERPPPWGYCLLVLVQIVLPYL